MSDGYKNYITENEIPDVTNSEDGVALFRVQGSGPENMQAIQVEAVRCPRPMVLHFHPVHTSANIHIVVFLFFCSHQVGSSLNSSYCYILHSGPTVFTWCGSLTTPDDQELVERFLDVIKVIVIRPYGHNIHGWLSSYDKDH